MDGLYYSYSPETFEYLKPVIGQESPLEPGVYWMPANSTQTAPLLAGENEVAVFINGSWALTADFRGQTVYDCSTSAANVVEGIGAIPDGWTLIEPPSKGANQVAVFENDAWALYSDFRGQTIYEQSSEASKEVTEIGDIPAGWSLTKPPTLSEAKALKLVEINKECSLLLAVIKEGYPDDEIQSWTKQELEARGYIANSSPTPLLSILATVRGIDLSEVVANVIQKADLFTTMSGQAIGKRQKYKDQVNAATDIATVNAIIWI